MACRILTILSPLGLSFLAFCVSYSSGRTAAEWKSRVVYQVVTDRFAFTSKSPTSQCSESDNYCKGTFKGIQRNLDYITGLGVNAIWISPFTLNTNDSSGDIDYFGRWPLDIYQINPYFGTSQDLIDLVNACHSRDIWVMADLVIRNMGYQDGCRRSSYCPPTDNFEKFTPFNKPEHYDERSTWVDNLPKLNHTNSFVRTTLINWVRDLSEGFRFDGFRLDDVDGISEEFLEELNNSTQIFMIGQTTKTERELAEYQRVLDSVFDGDMYSKLNTFFGGSGGSNGYYRIPDALSLRRAWFADGAVLGGYLDNHDVIRFVDRYSNDYTKLRNALAYLLMAEWIPFIYYGTEQGDSLSSSSSLWPFYVEERSLYQFISTILKHRKNLFGSAVSDYQNVAQVDCSYGTTFYSFTRKTTFVIISNRGYTSSTFPHLIRKHPFDKGTELVNIFDSTDKVTVQENGTFYVFLENGEPKIYSGGSHLGQSLLLVMAMCLLVLYERAKV